VSLGFVLDKIWVLWSVTPLHSYTLNLLTSPEDANGIIDYFVAID